MGTSFIFINFFKSLFRKYVSRSFTSSHLNMFDEMLSEHVS